MKKKENKIIYKITKLILYIIIISILSILIYEIYNNIEIDYSDEYILNDITKVSQDIKKQAQSEEITDIIENVTPCVVGISKIKEKGSSVFLNNNVEELGIGTGVIVSENGYILTNEHVSGSRYSKCYITIEHGKVYDGLVVWSDTDLDLSIVKINANNLPVILLGNSDKIKVAETVYAIGNPIGLEFQKTVTKGIVSALNRTIKIQEEEKSSYMEDLIQTDATINPGNSGGPLINLNGEVIGINSVKITSAEGIGFAIPINIVKPIVEKFIAKEEFNEAIIGIFAYDKEVIPYLETGLEFENGIYVVEVFKNGPAENAGLKIGDIITKIDNINLEKMSGLRKYIYTKLPNDKVQLEILRNKKVINIEIILGTKYI